MRRNCVAQVVLVVLLLNVIHLIFFASTPAAPRELLKPAPVNKPPDISKPWPELPSHSSWLPTHGLEKDACEYYFGNGFTVPYDLLRRLGGEQKVAGPATSGLDLAGSELVEESRLRKELQDAAAGVSVDVDSKEQEEFEGASGKAGWRKLKRELGSGELERPSDPVLPDGSLTCAYSETLRTSVCEGTGVVMNVDKLKMSRGGEAVEAVIGRSDEEELPVFYDGAFSVVTNRTAADIRVTSGQVLDGVMPRGHINFHTMRALFESMRTLDPAGVRCTKRIKEPTLFVTRFEYANLFHTVTDWYSAYVASRVARLKQRPRVILLDGHCKSPFDDGWEAMFSDVSYAMHHGGTLCFDKAIFVPLGYETALFKGLETGLPCRGCSLQECQSKPEPEAFTSRLREFGEFFVTAMDAKSENAEVARGNGSEGKKNVRVLFIRREAYLAHPRHSGKPESRVSNEEEVYDALVKCAAARSELVRSGTAAGHTSGRTESRKVEEALAQNVSIINGFFAHMSLRDQVQQVQNADIILGAHGAGMTHIIFARPGTVILELLSPLFARPHYAYIAGWMGLPYESIIGQGNFADPSNVVTTLDMLLNQLNRIPS